MTRRAAAVAVAVAAAVSVPVPDAGADAGAPIAAASLQVGSPVEAKAVMARLAGQHARLAGSRVHIDDVAGEGRPWVGVVERRTGGLWLTGDGFALELRGPLARPRVAGPGYRVWVTGDVAGTTLTARRLGVLVPRR